MYTYIHVYIRAKQEKTEKKHFLLRVVVVSVEACAFQGGGGVNVGMLVVSTQIVFLRDDGAIAKHSAQTIISRRGVG